MGIKLRQTDKFHFIPHIGIHVRQTDKLFHFTPRFDVLDRPTDKLRLISFLILESTYDRRTDISSDLNQSDNAPVCDIFTGLVITGFDNIPNKGFQRAYATGVACRQGTLTPPDTWSCPTLGLACVLMSRPISPELVLSPDF